MSEEELICRTIMADKDVPEISHIKKKADEIAA